MSSLHQSSSGFVDRAQAILKFWFGDPSDPRSDYGQQRKLWFHKDPEFDAAIGQRFQADYENARARKPEPVDGAATIQFSPDPFARPNTPATFFEGRPKVLPPTPRP